MKRQILVGTIAVVCASPLAAAPRTPDEAAQALAEKQKAREEHRAQPVTISTGELEDLKARVASLQAQVDQLKTQLTEKSSTAAVKRHDLIEIGMTKAEVMAFINRDKTHWKVVSMSASSGTSKSSAQVKIHDSGNSVVRKGNEGESLSGTGKAKEVDANLTRDVQVTTNGPKVETMEIAHFTTVRQQVGSHVDDGRVMADYAAVPQQSGTIHVTMEDEVVTAVDAR